MRATDTVARIGGDEFVVVAPVSLPEQGKAVADKLLAEFKPPREIGKEIVLVSASIGLALCPNDGKDAASLLQVVDRAMHSAKSAGKSRYQQATLL